MEKFWDRFSTWEEAEDSWNHASLLAASKNPLKEPSFQPLIPPIAPGERAIRWKALWWVLKHDIRHRLLKNFFCHPLRYLRNYTRSCLQKEPFHREGELFYFGVQNMEQYRKLLSDKNTLLLVGLSYCHKPFECPSGRFSNQCIADLQNPICKQCVIGKIKHSLPKDDTVFIIVPTINAIGEAVFSTMHEAKNRQVVFLITACEMALTMFSDMGNMIPIQGLGVRLGGRFCNTIEAFKLSESGKKPGLTRLSLCAEDQIFKIIRFWRTSRQAHIKK